MKKILCLISALCFLGANFSNLNAQLIADDFRLGFYVAPGFDWMNAGNTEINTDGGGSVGFGLIADIYLAENFIIGSGINCQYASGDVTVDGLADTIILTNVGRRTGEYKLGYIDIPITIKLMTNDVGYMRYFGQLGISTGFPLLRTRYTLTEDDGTIVEGKKENEKMDGSAQFVNLSLAAAVGAEYALTENTSVYAALWLNNGFTSVLRNKAFNDYHPLDDTSDNKVSLGTLSLRLGVIF